LHLAHEESIATAATIKTKAKKNKKKSKGILNIGFVRGVYEEKKPPI